MNFSIPNPWRNRDEPPVDSFAVDTLPHVDPVIEPHSRHLHALADDLAAASVDQGHLDEHITGVLPGERVIAQAGRTAHTDVVIEIGEEGAEIDRALSVTQAAILTVDAEIADGEKQVAESKARVDDATDNLEPGQRRWTDPSARLGARVLILALAVGDTVLLYRTLDQFGDDDRIRILIVIAFGAITGGASHIAGLNRAASVLDSLPAGARRASTRLAVALLFVVGVLIAMVATLRGIEAASSKGPGTGVIAGFLFASLQVLFAMLSFWLGRQMGPAVDEYESAVNDYEAAQDHVAELKEERDELRADVAELTARRDHRPQRQRDLTDQLREVAIGAMHHHRSQIVNRWPDQLVAMHLRRLPFPEIDELGPEPAPIPVSPIILPGQPGAGSPFNGAAPTPASTGALILNLVNPNP